MCTLTCTHAYSLSEKEAEEINGPCHFMNGTGRSTVALVSFPGSGNTWVRGLLETATGVCTGEYYIQDTKCYAGRNGKQSQQKLHIQVCGLLKTQRNQGCQG